VEISFIIRANNFKNVRMMGYLATIRRDDKCAAAYYFLKL
jgi:hypothetical protein